MMSNDADSLLVYTKNKAEVLEYITDEYQDLYDTWDSGKKTQFVWIYDKDDYDFPLQMFSNRDPFVFQSKGPNWVAVSTKQNLIPRMMISKTSCIWRFS